MKRPSFITFQMAKAGDRYEERTGNIWSYSNRGDLTGLKAALARGVDVNILNTVGWTPTHAAAAGGQTSALRVLVKAGADLTIADKGGNLPVHHAAKNGHMHSLKVLQDLGADVGKVRLSQVKGKGARDFVIAAHRKNNVEVDGADRAEEEEENHVVVGYARKQAKSTAFWGPRRTPISCKIKKKILEDKRKVRNGKNEEEQLTIQDRKTEPTVEQEQLDHLKCSNNDIFFEETGYLQTVQLVKRNKKLKRLAKQGRKTCANSGVTPCGQLEKGCEKELEGEDDKIASCSDVVSLSTDEEEDIFKEDDSDPSRSHFAALLSEDSDSCSD